MYFERAFLPNLTKQVSWLRKRNTRNNQGIVNLKLVGCSKVTSNANWEIYSNPLAGLVLDAQSAPQANVVGKNFRVLVILREKLIWQEVLLLHHVPGI